ncbi:unnamed protein product [Chrysoparadoxa australica]
MSDSDCQIVEVPPEKRRAARKRRRNQEPAAAAAPQRANVQRRQQPPRQKANAQPVWQPAAVAAPKRANVPRHQQPPQQNTNAQVAAMHAFFADQGPGGAVLRPPGMMGFPSFPQQFTPPMPTHTAGGMPVPMMGLPGQVPIHPPMLQHPGMGLEYHGHKGTRGVSSSKAGSEEVKEEPDDLLWRPAEHELVPVSILKKMGLYEEEAVKSLRACGGDYNRACIYALQKRVDREESRQLDQARLDSEQDEDRRASEKRKSQEQLLREGPIIGNNCFDSSVLLREDGGSAAMRRELLALQSATTQEEPSGFRSQAVNLLFLEQKCYRWYSASRDLVKHYFQDLASRLEESASKPPADGGVKYVRVIERLTEAMRTERERLEEIVYKPHHSAMLVLPKVFLDYLPQGGSLDDEGIVYEGERASREQADLGDSIGAAKGNAQPPPMVIDISDSD